MKRTMLVMMVFIAAFSNVSAQFTAGAKVGLNRTKEYYGRKIMDEDIDFRTGLNAGIYGKYGLSDRFDVQAELLYSQQGYKSSVPLTDVGGTAIVGGYKALSHYLNVPVLLKYYPFNRIYIEAGPQVGFCLGYTYSSGHKEYDEALKTLDTDYNTVDFSLAGGIGLYIGYGLSFNARYIHGFTKTVPHYQDGKNRTIQFSLAYDLWEL
ncbi:MAG: PorT family protein [Tannerella sp.]|jgi:hypothetical protein|nr:PorT family protein [Tannerella sp.]